MKKVISILLSLIAICGYSQEPKAPKLIIGVVVDQMRADYLVRFAENYSENGFKRMMREGFEVSNMHYNYIPTATGPGHASIYTGTTPQNHGIVGNYWFDRASNQTMYCAQDNEEEIIGSTNKSLDYARSPKNMLASSITDQLKLNSPSSKVIGMSIKDRGAILPAGHNADFAFWYHQESGNFISSSFYTDELPSWLVQFNERNMADSLLNLTWNFYLDESKYTNSQKDDREFEKIYKGRKKPTFPYNLKDLRAENGNYKMLSQVPFGNTILTDLAITTIQAEQLGQDNSTDFLTLSYSSTDYIGHNFGIHSKEIEDTYIRLDRELERLLNYLDEKVGNGEYLLFLTADHGASETPINLKRNHLPHGFFESKAIKEKLNEYLTEQYGNRNYIKYFDKTQVYLNDSVRHNQEILNSIHYFLTTQVDGLKAVYIPNLKGSEEVAKELQTIFRNSHHPNSGDILLHFKQGWMAKRSYGTSHSNAYNGDTHVPSLWFGYGINKGKSNKKYTIDQIVPTLCFISSISLPESTNKNGIKELIK